MIQKQWATAGGKAAVLLTQVISWPEDESCRIESHGNTNVLGGLLIQTLVHELQRETLNSLSKIH